MTTYALIDQHNAVLGTDTDEAALMAYGSDLANANPDDLYSIVPVASYLVTIDLPTGIVAGVYTLAVSKAAAITQVKQSMAEAVYTARRKDR